jgi:uncharacterized protein YggE
LAQRGKEKMQEITNPLGITVFGSSVIRVEPDFVSLNLSISYLAEKPQDGFREVHLITQSVREFLMAAHVQDVATSQVTLARNSRYVNGEEMFLGYKARMEFNVILKDLQRLEEVILGAMDKGINEIGGTEFHSSQLKACRAKARENAVSAAKEKAESYCRAAGVKLGGILHIEDVNPEVMRSRESHGWVNLPHVDDAGPVGAFNPTAILIAGAVRMAFAIENK